MRKLSRSSQKLKNQASYASEYDIIRKQFDDACTKVADHYSLFYSNGKPRKAQIIEAIARTTCTSCINGLLREKPVNLIDNFYIAIHSLASNILVEELAVQLTEKGFSVLVANEKNLEYGRVDILIIPNRHGVDLHLNRKEIVIELKTGRTFSFSQIFRYMLDNEERTLILWRIRNRQVLLFEGNRIKPLLAQFMKMIISRAERLLSNQEMPCEHVLNCNNWSPNQQQLQEAFTAFSNGIIATLPSVVETVEMMLNEERPVQRV